LLEKSSEVGSIPVGSFLWKAGQKAAGIIAFWSKKWYNKLFDQAGPKGVGNRPGRAFLYDWAEVIPPGAPPGSRPGGLIAPAFPSLCEHRPARSAKQAA
jgi:hypothetical protein